ncbi:MAG: hypothetical protein IKC73_02345, partial [Clostridia bacterium]|nr:hypothetical protein [Clostridia bacterium]
MKKRLLSMLLLAVMVITAVPLGVLTVFAEGEPEAPSFEAEDYNALYVQDGLFFAADFFSVGESGTLKETTDFAPYVWSGKGTLSAKVGASLAGGKLSFAEDVLTVKPAGSMGATDYNLTVEHVLDAKSFSANTKAIYLRGGYLGSNSNAGLGAATEEQGATLGFAYYAASGGPASWGFGNGWKQGTYDGFTRYYLGEASGTLAFRKGADTVSYVMNFADYIDLSKDEVEALKLEVAAGTKDPAFRIYNASGLAFTKDVPDHAFYADASCIIGYRLNRQKSGNSYEWLDENFAPYEGITQAILEGLTAENCTYKLYATKAEAEAAKTAAAAADPTAKFRVDAVYSQSMDETPYGVNPALFVASGWTDSIGGGDATFTGDVYAIRYYSRALSETEILQNHFADLAKYYKVDLTGFAGIDETLIADVYDAVANVQIGDAGAAEAVRTAIVDGVEATYALLKVDGQASRNAFIDVAAALMADLDLVATVVSSLRPMEPVYEAIAANNATAAYTSAADLEADVRELYAAQYFYDSYKGDSADLNAFLAYAKAEALSIEELMSIPYDDRVAFATANKGENSDFAGVTQDTVDAYAAEVLARYAAFLPKDYAYDSLYVQTGLVGQIDFFKLNAYWADIFDTENPAPVLPTHPAATEEFDSVTERLDMTKGFILVAYGDEPARGVNPPAATEDDPFRAAERYVYTYTGNNESFSTAWIHDRDLAKAKTYATKEEAVAALEALKADVAIKAAILPERAPHPYNSWPSPDESKTQAVSYGVYYAPVLNSDYKKAVSKYEIAVEKLLNTFLVAGATTFDVKLPEISGISSHDHDGSAQRVAYELGAGYIQQNYFSGQSYLSINGVPMTGALTGEVVMTAGERAPDRDHTNFFTFSDAALKRLGKADGSIVFELLGAYNGIGTNRPSSPVTLSAKLTDAVSYTALVDRSASPIKTSVYADGSVILPEQSVNDSTPTSVVTTFGYGTSSESKIFAMRFYQKSLTTDEMAQNHFADLAKYFRLDLSVFDCLSADQKAVVYKAFAGIRLTDDVSKKALQALYDEIVGKVYYDTLTLTLTNDAALNRQFLALAKLVGMDVTVLEGVDPTSFEPVARDILSKFDPAFAQNKAVVASYTDASLKPYSTVTFAGYQVRVDSGAAAANTAGVRAVFDVDTALLAKLSAKGAITFGVKVFAKDADESHAELRFTYNAET